MTSLLPLFEDLVLPPVDRRGRYYKVVIVNKKLLLRRSWVASPGAWQFQCFHLFVRFPKRWSWTMQFSEIQFNKIIRAVNPLLDLAEYDPIAVYSAAQTAIYGEFRRIGV